MLKIWIRLDYVPKYVLLAIENLNKIIPKNEISIKLINSRLDSNVVLYIGERDDVEKKVPTLLYDVENDILDYTELEIYDRLLNVKKGDVIPTIISGY